jgi:N,N'-diacetyllegionaminate synthase
MIFVVAEIGVNWDGDFELVNDMMKNAKIAGCNAVKFQSFDELIVKEHPKKELLLKTSISKSNIDEIDKIAKSVKIEWFSTPMYPEAVTLLDPYVDKYKIRNFDGEQLVKNHCSDLVKKVLDTGKEIIVSSYTEPSSCKMYNNNKISWLYVVPKYPCKLYDLDFSKLHKYQGYSNHCPEIIAPVTASILGSKIIEIHITSDKNKNFVDNAVSFDYLELKQVVSLIRKSENIKIN